MPAELNGPNGRLVVEDSGALSFYKDGRGLLQTASVPVFCEIYGVSPALTGPEIDAQPDYLTLTYQVEAAYTGGPVVLTLEVSPTETGFLLTLNAPPPLMQVGFNFNPASAGSWYGLGERVIQSWPLDAAGVKSDPFIPFDYAKDGTLNLITPLLLSQSGAGLLLEESAGEFFINLNRHSESGLQLGQVARETNPEVSFIHATNAKPGATMALHVFLAENTAAATQQAIKILGHPTVSPPQDLWANPIWTTWARYKMDVTQEKTLAFADEIIAHGYPHSVMEIDDRWQTAYGNLAFDLEKFPDPAAMVAGLHQKGFRVTLWVPPFFDPASDAFAEAARLSLLVKERGSGNPVVIKWWQGLGGLLDTTNPAALDWWRSGLQRLQTEYGVDGFKFDGGEANFVPENFQTFQPIERRTYPDHYVAWVAKNFPWTEVRTGWRSQQHGILFRQWDKWSRWGMDNGLHSVLTQALTMSITGYPFILPDMIGGNAYRGEEPDAELLVRWTQLNAVLPAMQFSIPPWAFDDATSEICLKFVQLHHELTPYLQNLFDETLRSGTPLVLPLFWHFPADPATYAIDDEFLLGPDLLAAPVLKPGATSRDLYLPAGSWRDRLTGQIYQGPQTLKDYPAPLEVLPLFERAAALE